jgi:hypothetical protein
MLAVAVGLPMLLVALLFAVLDDGRCETRGPDCQSGGPPYGLIWLGIVAGSFGLAWAMNARINRLRYEREGKEEAEGGIRGRDIWFDTFLGSYMPCHTKGWAFIAAMVVIAMSAVQALILLGDVFGRPDLEGWAYLMLLPVIGCSWIISERHSARRPR